MNDWIFSTPVVFFIFNRPDTTRQVFEAIRRARPSKLLVVADGPREQREGEVKKCAAVRAIVEHVDWECEVLRNYSDSNLGCKKRIASGLNWAFEQVEQAIILEDDCLPHPTFFRFCDELLEKYRENDKVMHISGDNFQFGKKHGNASYYFSRYAHIWGWATWRRAWRNFDVNIEQWCSAKNKNVFLEEFEVLAEKRFWETAWNRVCAGEVDAWGYQWAFTGIARKGLSIMPNVNLVSNIGFGEDSTHTTMKSRVANIPTTEMRFPLIHPQECVHNIEADESTSRLFFQKQGFIKSSVRRIKRFLLDDLGPTNK